MKYDAVGKGSKNHLIVIKDESMINATLHTYMIPDDGVGPAHKKYAYSLSDCTEIACGWTKGEALELLLVVATERKWRVFHPLN